MNPGPDRVFVYGTLRRGQCNHHWLKGARFLGEHTTEPRFILLDLGVFPGVMTGQGVVMGEVYAIDAPLLARLDYLEDYPREYTRERIDTPFGQAWIYLYRHAPVDAPVIGGGDWCRRD
ncbi:MAG: gamma-glutamylcyclotransferase [Candidatus Competibacteraceae bacterium]|nr:gamma-glutamylcyclotransferase [Candidatus Competibacteraceae bacterium]